MSSAATAPFPVTVIGVGNMGAAMVQRLCALGWAPSVHDVVPQRGRDLLPFGALPGADIAQTASKSIATNIAVVNAVQVREVLFGVHGIAPRLPPGHVLVLCPTLGPQVVEDIAQTLAAQGVDVVDAPMSPGHLGEARPRGVCGGRAGRLGRPGRRGAVGVFARHLKWFA